MPPLYTRKTHLDQAIITLGGTAYTKTFKSFNCLKEDMEGDGRAIGERYQDPVRTKSKFTFGGSVLRTLAGVRQSMLSFTVFTIGGTSKLGRLESGSLSGTTVVDEFSAGNDPDEYPGAMGTDIEIRALMKITDSAEYQTIMAGNTAAREVLVVLTMGGASVTMPAKIRSVNHTTEGGKVQSEEVILTIKGSVALAVTGDTLLIAAIIGSAAIAFSADTGANVYSAVDGAIITSFGFTFSNGQIIEDNFQFQACGPVTTT